jgi:F0F1-type ATP synthase gamma subunit
MDLYESGQIGSAEVIHARCHSFTRQTLEVTRLLPFSIADIEPRPQLEEAAPDYLIVEPDARRLVEYTIALWLSRRLYAIYWDSKLSEAACRAIELNERYEALRRQREKTLQRYFRACHEVIDAGIREVFASHHFFAARSGTREDAA